MQQRIEKLLTKKIKTKTKTINKYKIKKNEFLENIMYILFLI